MLGAASEILIRIRASKVDSMGRHHVLVLPVFLNEGFEAAGNTGVVTNGLTGEHARDTFGILHDKDTTPVHHHLLSFKNPRDVELFGSEFVDSHVSFRFLRSGWNVVSEDLSTVET